MRLEKKEGWKDGEPVEKEWRKKRGKGECEVMEEMVGKREGGGGRAERRDRLSEHRCSTEGIWKRQPLRAEEMGKTDKPETRGWWEKCCGRTLWLLMLKWSWENTCGNEKTDRLQEGLKKEEILSSGCRRVVHRSLVSHRWVGRDNRVD